MGLGDERYRAHRAVRRLLEQLAVKPLVLALDDLQWADDASIELIGALLRRAPEAPVLFAFGFRARPVPARLTAALAVPWVARHELAPLSETEAAELLSELDPPSRASVYRYCGGNPFYLKQLARGRVPSGLPPASARNGAGLAAVPPAVAAALAEELGSISASARALLDAAAVAGEPFETDLAGEIASQDQAQVLAALDELLAVDILRPTDVPRRFAFRHPLVREAVYESAPGGWRLAAHAAAAAALAERGAPAAERAHHVEQSARPGDEQAIDLLLAAADSAAPRAPLVAARWLRGGAATPPRR